MNAPDPLINEKQLCAWLGVGRATASRWRQSGRGPRFVQLSARRLAYRKSDIEQWLASREREAGAIARVADNSNVQG